MLILCEVQYPTHDRLVGMRFSNINSAGRTAGSEWFCSVRIIVWRQENNAAAVRIAGESQEVLKGPEAHAG